MIKLTLVEVFSECRGSFSKSVVVFISHYCWLCACTCLQYPIEQLHTSVDFSLQHAMLQVNLPALLHAGLPLISKNKIQLVLMSMRSNGASVSLLWIACCFGTWLARNCQKAATRVSPCSEVEQERTLQPWESWFSWVSSGAWGNVGWGRQSVSFSALEYVLVHRRKVHMALLGDGCVSSKQGWSTVFFSLCSFLICFSSQLHIT